MGAIMVDFIHVPGSGTELLPLGRRAQPYKDLIGPQIGYSGSQHDRAGSCRATSRGISDERFTGPGMGHNHQQLIQSHDHAFRSTLFPAVSAQALRITAPWHQHLQTIFGDHWLDALSGALILAVSDLIALTARDPAAHNSWREVIASYRCYHAVLCYRIANHIHYHSPKYSVNAEVRRILARSISEQAKVETGVELHPAARIGARFIVDHGIGTVVGETADIGDDCYLLQGVVLGSTGIRGNPAGKRHPTLGDRVEVGAFARIFGPVTIGSDAIIGPHSLVCEDVAPGSRVSVLHQYQVIANNTDLSVDGIEAAGPNRFRIHGNGLHDAGLCVELCDPERRVASLPVRFLERSRRHLLVEISTATSGRHTHLRLFSREGASTTIMTPRVRLRRRRKIVRTEEPQG